MKKRTSNAKRYYLAYGSNLNTVEMKYRCPSAKVIGTAEISGWRLLFRGNWMGYLTIEPCEGACVPVAVWEVSPDDESSLDSYEGFPDFYDKQDMRLPVRETGGRETSERDAFIYIMKERFSPLCLRKAICEPVREAIAPSDLTRQFWRRLCARQGRKWKTNRAAWIGKESTYRINSMLLSLSLKSSKREVLPVEVPPLFFI